MSGIKKSKVLKSSLSIFLALTIIFSSAYVGLSEIDFSGIKFTNPFAVKTNAVSVDDLDLIYGTDEGITRAEWLHNLVVVFDMTIEDESLPDNYYADLTEEHKYYSDILLATEFGVVNVEAGGELRPDDYVTRDFAASTLNFCLGYQLGEDATYTFTDSDACSDPVSAQIALNREWFELTDGCFAPETLVSASEAEAMLGDAFEVLERQNVDENHENEYEFASNVIVIPDGTLVEKGEDGKIYITDCPESLLVGDNFAVYFNGIPCFYKAVEISFEDNVTVIDVTELEVDEALKNIDAQGVINADDMEIIPYEGVDVSVEKENDFSTFSIKKVDTITSGVEVDFGGITGKVFIKVKNPYIDYYVRSDRVYVALCGETEIVYNVSASTAEASGMKNGFPLYKCNIYGVGSFDITINVDFSGTASGVVTGWLVAGVECAKNEGIRAVKSFTQKECYTNIEAQAKVSLRASFNVSEMPVLKAHVYAEAGIKVNFSKKTFKEGVPTTCTHFAAYLFAEYGASASAKFGLWKTSESITCEIFNEANSPVRIVNHYEDGQLVPECTRGTTYATSGYYTKASSRWSGCGWISAGGGYALNADGTQFKLYNYTLDDNNNATITKYNGNAWSVYIPEEIDGYTVKAIGNYAFVDKNARSISIPDTVTKIGSYTFRDCTSLKNVTLSKSLVSLGNCAFNNTAIESIEIPKSLDSCASSDSGSYTLDGVKYSYYEAGPFGLCENLKTVTFEKGTTQIAQYLFTGCVGLEKITIPDTVTVIEEGAFKQCFRLKEVTIPDSVTKIDNDAFNGCTSLKNVTLSKSLVSIGNAAFGDTAIESIEIPKSLDSCGSGWWSSYTFDGVKYSYYEAGPFALCENLKTVTFEKGTTQIAQNLFMGCVGLEKITIPDTVTVIEEGAFKDCFRLKEVTMPDSVTEIGGGAFERCVSLPNIIIPDSVTSMGDYCFDGCSSLESVKLPNKRVNITRSTFDNCTSLKTIDFPKTVQTIQSYAFYGCTALEDFTFSEGSNLKEIGYEAFYGCSSLKEANLPETLETIDYYAFKNCVALEKVNIPQSVHSLGSEAFMSCEALETVDIADYSIKEIKSNTFKDCPGLKKIVLPKGLTKIGSQAFMNDTGLTEVVIPESVTSIDSTAFSYPAKTTIYGKAGSYAETFANNGGFKFVDINVPAEGLILKDGVENITLDVGETYRAEFEFYPEDANDVVTLTSNNDNVAITLHDIYARYTGDSVITATATSGLTYEFNVHIRNVKNISIIKQPTKLSYLMGESLDLSGMEIQVNYNDGSSKIVTDYTVSGFDSSAEGTSTVTVKWIGANGRAYTTTFDVEIVDPTPKVTGIYIDTLPDKIQYQLREKLDLTGMVVKATLTDGSEKEVADYTTSSINVLKKGAQVVTVTYNGFTTSFTVYVCTADHSYGDWVTDAEATCTQPGMQHKTCSVCGYILTDEKASLGHNYSTEWTIDEVASCTEDGSKSHHCTRCDDKADVTVVKATGHNNVVLEAQASHPHTTTYKCSWCDTVTTENSVAADCVECNFTITSLDSNSYQLSSYIGLGIDVVIPAEYNGRKITTIANSCFKNNKTITSVKIAGGVTSIGSLAFMSCTSLGKVFIPASVTSIGTRAFYGFTGKIYCASGSYAHEYAVANDIDYVLVSVVETEDTQIDYDKLLICTSVQNCNDITKIFGLSETAFVVPTASYIYGSIELYGTGTIVTVFDGDDYVGDFTLIVEGDTNGDSVCDVIDCFEVERALNGNAELTGAYAMAADSNTDDIVDINDYQSIVNKALAS